MQSLASKIKPSNISIFYRYERPFMLKPTILALTVTLTSSFSINANALDQIPKSFHGRWGAPGQCNDSGELPTEIKTLRYQPYEMTCDLKKVIKSSDTLFIGNFSCSFEGEEELQKHTLELKGGKLYEDGRGPTSRCK